MPAAQKPTALAFEDARAEYPARQPFYIDRPTKAELDGYRAAKDSTVVNLLLDKKIPGNRLLTSYESKALLGD
jgi:hypothetical protein